MMLDFHQFKRRFFINMNLRRVRPGAGSSIEHFKKRNWNLPVSDINSIFRSTPFVVCGGVATRAYSPERKAEDLDRLIRQSQAALAYRELEDAGSIYIGKLSLRGSRWLLPDQTRLNVLKFDTEWADDAIRNPNFDNPHNLPIISLPYLVLIKLALSKTIDLADISRMMAQANQATLNETKKLVAQYLPSASEDLECLIYLGQLEIQPELSMNSSYQETNKLDDASINNKADLEQ